MTKKEMKKNGFRIVLQANVPESLQTIVEGETVKVPCVEFASLGVVRSAVARINQNAGYKKFEVGSPDNGATIVIKRNSESQDDCNPEFTK